jgi:1-acyl-sn-glycerol-3-phosphate acyltransferase
MQLLWRTGYWVLLPIAKIGLGLEVEGRQFVPRTGALIVASNHLSHIDPPLIGVAVAIRELYFLARHDLWKSSKFFGWLITKLNAIPLRKDGASIETFRTAMNLLKGGKALMIFPEGTRSKTGRLQEPQIGLGYIASKSGARILPVHVRDSNARVVDLMRRRSRLAVKFGEPLDPLKIGEGLGKKERYRRISEEVMNSIRLLGESHRLD